MRLFLAIELPNEVRAHLQSVRERLESALPKIAYTRNENLHLTLKFLGEVEPKRVALITDSIARIRSTRIEMAASGMECFPNRGAITIAAAAMEGSAAPVRALVESIEQRCKFLGFAREQRAYRAHVTLARARPVLSAKFRPIIEDATADLWPGPTFSPTEFVLMDSQLSPQGSTYAPIERFPLTAV